MAFLVDWLVALAYMSSMNEINVLLSAVSARSRERGLGFDEE